MFALENLTIIDYMHIKSWHLYLNLKWETDPFLLRIFCPLWKVETKIRFRIIVFF